MIAGFIIISIYHYCATFVFPCRTQKFIWFGCCSRQKINQPHGHTELQTQFQLSSEAQHLHDLMGELERDEKGGEKKTIGNFSLEAGFAGKAAVLLHGMLSLGERLLPVVGSRNSQGCSREFLILPPKGEAARSQEEICALHVSYWRGRAQHSRQESQTHSVQLYTIIPTEEL